MEKELKQILVPDSYNYIGVFLTLECNLKCSYCINNFEGNEAKRETIPGKVWVKLLNRLHSRGGLPISLQGGEPSVHPDFLYIINNIRPELNIDILTNLKFDIDEFIKSVNPDRIKRDSPYASIRVTYHPETMDLEETVGNVLKMLDKGYSIGIWSVLHPRYKEQILKAQEECVKKGIDFRIKEFLGEYQGKVYGLYKYEDACSKNTRKSVLCKTTELLIDPQTRVFRCHHDLYKGTNYLGGLFSEVVQIEDKYRPCEDYGFCNPCDIKVKTNRFQGDGHTSVDVKFLDKRTS
ncbi:MAG: radical SAM protein [Candidatus Omnitrophota bacterium]